MTIVHTVDRIAHWLEREICKGWDLKRSPLGPDTQDYEYELVEPCVYPFYDPVYASDKVPNVKALAPSILVQVDKGADDIYGQKRTYNVRLSFNIYDSGIHGEDWLYPYCDVETHEVRYRRGDHGSFEVQFDGWRDLWNIVDRSMRILETHEAIDGMPIIKDVDIEFGPFTYADEVPDTYPLWVAWITFSVSERLIRNTDYRKFL